MTERKYPIGIQTFPRIIGERCLYIDKTDIVWDLSHYAPFVFMSRPRRFGKSLLSSTLESYFKGERELFEGLKIMALEKEWVQYPVLHMDLSSAKGQPTAEDLRARLMLMLEDYAEQYGRKSTEVTPGGLLEGIIKRANEKTGRQVAVIIDEYDAPLLEVLLEDETLNAKRMVMQEFYQPLKANEALIKFCFITGITKFSQLSSHTPTRTHDWTFSTINNLMNVTMDPRFSAICGITENELVTAMKEDIERLAQAYEVTPEEMHEKLKLRYDGYHFSENSQEIYNPYSLLKAFLSKKLDNYWFESGTPTFLIQQMKHFGTDIMSLDHLEVPSSAFDQPTENMEDALPLLYQSGYLTIKDYDRESEAYTLSLPNQEVRVGYVRGLLPAYTGLKSSDVQMGFALKFWRALKSGDADLALREMQAYMSGVPYVEGFKRKLEDVAAAEGFYEYTMYLIFSMLNVYVRTQVKCAKGRADMVVWLPDAIYVFEMKVDGTAQEALAQINDRGYAIPYKAEMRKVVKVGVKFDVKTRIPESWAIG